MNSVSFVVDTNLIFSALISKHSGIRNQLFDDKLTFYAPDFLITEIYKHKNKLLKYSKLTESELYLYLSGIFERIDFVPASYVGSESRQKAYDLCKDIDIKDTPFIALSIELNVPIWTGDKKLRNALTKKGFDNFFRIDS